MSNQEENTLEEIFVRVKKTQTNKGDEGAFDIPNAIINHYSIKSGDGIICVLKEKIDKSMKNAEKIDKEILIDVGGPSPRGIIPVATYNLYDIKDLDYVRLLIRKVIHEK